jgi:hypothetical protein
MTAIAARALEAGVDFALLKDPEGAAARALGVERTPEVVVIDAQRRLRYRGRIDDRHRLGGEREAPTREDLREALEDVLAGREVRVPETTVDGCRLAGAPAREGPTPTFADVLPILQRSCQECHRPGGNAPFSLVSYDDAWSMAETIAEVVRDERMPPWYGHGGPFLDERALAREEKEALVAWAAGGAPRGDPSREPPARELPPVTGWLLTGEPDLVVEAAAPAELPAEGYIPYRYELLPYVFEHETWISEAQIRPSNGRVLHHCNMAYVLPEDGFKQAHFISGQVPGGEPMNVPEGMGFRLPAGAMLVLQIHYVTTGKPERDRVSVGLRYPRWQVTKEVRHVRIDDGGLAIPPNDRAHEVRRTSRALDADVTGLALFTHMHLRGRDATFLAHAPGAEPQRLLTIPAYSFDWQLVYHYAPGQLRLPKGTRIEHVGHFDNSAWNPYNPDPSATVPDGPQTHEEMFIGFFFYTRDDERLAVRVDPRTGREVPKRFF